MIAGRNDQRCDYDARVVVIVVCAQSEQRKESGEASIRLNDPNRTKRRTPGLPVRVPGDGLLNILRAFGSADLYRKRRTIFLSRSFGISQATLGGCGTLDI